MAHCERFPTWSPAVRGKPPFGGSKLTALIVALILAAAGAIVNWLQPPGQDGPRTAPSPQAQAPAQNRPGAALAGGVPQGSYTLTGAIVNVADGDTVTLRAPDGQRKIRMDSIDAPEEGHGADQPGQPYAEASRKHLAGLVAGKTLTAQCYEKDQYGRDVCALILEDGRSANRAQVEAGYAWAYTARQGDYLRDKAMPDLQRQARSAGRGLWAQQGAMQPWKWRYDCWRQRQCG
ncbi:thermonuclease family protein [Achromobacter sp. RTa]|uniref:thermonuclease family protein n=1 Tax=Achromobacter sp. RTa TaxID=1532557 RepID=UPI0009DE7DF3|nr:thermonuclease family protein [Achromobacter sp. RTa]